MKSKILVAMGVVSILLTGCQIGDYNISFGNNSDEESIVAELATDVIDTASAEKSDEEIEKYRDSILKTLTDNIEVKSTSGFMNVATQLAKLNCKDIKDIQVTDKADSFDVVVTDTEGLVFKFTVKRDNGLCKQISNGDGDIVWYAINS